MKSFRGGKFVKKNIFGGYQICAAIFLALKN